MDPSKTTLDILRFLSMTFSDEVSDSTDEFCLISRANVPKNKGRSELFFAVYSGRSD